jgi:hypothetical protein
MGLQPNLIACNAMIFISRQKLSKKSTKKTELPHQTLSQTQNIIHQ